MVWPRLRTRRKPPSRSSAETTSAFNFTDCAITHSTSEGITLQDSRTILLKTEKQLYTPDDAALERLI